MRESNPSLLLFALGDFGLLGLAPPFSSSSSSNIAVFIFSLVVNVYGFFLTGPLYRSAAKFFYFSANSFFFFSAASISTVGYLTNISGAFLYVGI